MIYLDTSVVLAQLLAEGRAPPPRLWQETLISSRLVFYEVWNRVNTRGLTQTHGDLVRELLNRIAFVEMLPPVLEWAAGPHRNPMRTLDTLHLATVEFLRSRRQRIELATYDRRLAEAARAIGVILYDFR